MSRPPKLKYVQVGFSIVELMISLVLGLLLMTGVIQVFLSSRQTYATNEAMARQQENGRFALEFIARSARSAGYSDPIFPKDKPLPSSLLRNGCTGLPGSVATVMNNYALCAPDGGGNASDGIGFVMQPQLIDGVRRDCVGNEIAEDDLLIINHFEIIPAAGTTPAALGCRAYKFNSATGAGSWTAGPNAKPLIDGVDSLQVLYGEDKSGDTRSANSYVSADRVSNWSRVRSIRIAVLANSINPVLPAPPDHNFVLLDAPPLASADFGDNRARQIFTTTIQLKNTD